MGLSYRLTALCTAIVFSLCSCATDRASREETTWSSPQSCIAAHTVGGALVGAVSGALIAAVSGKNLGRGAAMGSVAGGTLAFAYAWGKCFASFTKLRSVQSQSYRDAGGRIGYQSSQGTLVRISEYAIEPAAIAPGEKLDIHASYYVMAPSDRELTVKETVVLKVYNPEKNLFEEVGESSETIVVSPGQRKAVSEIPIPSNAEEGKFLIVLRVQMQGQKDEKEMPLTITRDQTILAKARGNSLRQSYSAPPPSEPPGGMAGKTLVAQAGSKEIRSGTTAYVTVTTSKANIRENPDPRAKVLAKASQGERFSLLASITAHGKQWHQIKLNNGKSAWIVASTCKLAE